MPVEVSLLDLLCVGGSRPLWPAEFRGFIEALEERPDDLTRWGILADWCDGQREPGLAAACRYLHRRPAITISRSSTGRYSHWSLNNLPAPLSYTVIEANVPHVELAGVLAELALKIKKAREELE